MKKLWIVSMFVFLAAASFAQSTENKFRFGVKAQPALAWFRIDAPDETNLESDGLPFGFGYGLITDFGFSDRYSFSTGLEVAYRGGKTVYSFQEDNAGNISTTTVKVKYSLQFIEIPLTLKLRTKEIGYMTYYFQAGLAPGYAIRTRAEIKVDDEVTDKNEDVGDNINELNLSMILSAGAEYNISGSTSLLFGLTFNNGFLDLLDDKGYGTKVKANSNYLSLTLGVMF